MINRTALLEMEAYVNLAEELDADPHFLADADEFIVKAASRFAARLELPWKPTAGGVNYVARLIASASRQWVAAGRDAGDVELIRSRVASRECLVTGGPATSWCVVHDVAADFGHHIAVNPTATLD